VVTVPIVRVLAGPVLPVSPLSPLGRTRFRVWLGDVPVIVADGLAAEVTVPIARVLLGPVAPIEPRISTASAAVATIPVAPMNPVTVGLEPSPPVQSVIARPCVRHP